MLGDGFFWLSVNFLGGVFGCGRFLLLYVLFREGDVAMLFTCILSVGYFHAFRSFYKDIPDGMSGIFFAQLRVCNGTVFACIVVFCIIVVADVFVNLLFVIRCGVPACARVNARDRFFKNIEIYGSGGGARKIKRAVRYERINNRP